LFDVFNLPEVLYITMYFISTLIKMKKIVIVATKKMFSESKRLKGIHP